jgi:hypothetical protein
MIPVMLAQANIHRATSTERAAISPRPTMDAGLHQHDSLTGFTPHPAPN